MDQEKANKYLKKALHGAESATNKASIVAWVLLIILSISYISSKS